MKKFVNINNYLLKKSLIREFQYSENTNVLLVYLDDGSYKTIHDVTKDDFIKFCEDVENNNVSDEIYDDDEWNINQIYSGEYQLGRMVESLEVMYGLHKKYPADENILDSVYTLRDEICNLFGGSIYKN